MKINDLLLAHYRTADFSTRIKAKMLLYIAMLLMLIMLLLMGFVAILLGSGFFLHALPMLAGIIVSAAAIALLKKGYYTAASHIIITLCLLSVWSVIALDDKNQGLVRLDTIVYVSAVLTMVPILADRKGIIAYNILNLAAFAVFVKFVLVDSLNMTGLPLGDYILDNTATFVIIGILTYLIHYINEEALRRSESEARINREQ